MKNKLVTGRNIFFPMGVILQIKIIIIKAIRPFLYIFVFKFLLNAYIYCIVYKMLIFS